LKFGFFAQYPDVCERLALNVKTIANIFRTLRY
jgi:hypothetical protein